ncbi:MAG TPA: Ycf66 family protein, partial [Chroococcidiopsis sp.]
MAYILAIAVGLSSFALYMAAFFFPELHRKYDLIWSGIGLFYALVLWVCAGRITGGVLLGQTASVALLGWFGWQTLLLRRELTPKRQRTLAGSNQTALQVVQANLKTMQHNLQAQWRSVMPFPAGSRPIAGSPAGSPVGSTPSSAPVSSPDTARPAGKKSRTARSGRSPQPERTSAPATPNPTGTVAASTPASLNSIANSEAPTVQLAAAAETPSPETPSPETPSPETPLPPTAPEQPDPALASDTQAPETVGSAASSPNPDAEPLESDAAALPASDAPTDGAIAESAAESAAEHSGERPADDRQNWADPFGDEDEILDAEFEEIGKPLSAQEQAVLARRTANDKRASRKTNLFGGLVSRIQGAFSKQRPPQTSPLPPAEVTSEPNPAIADRVIEDDDTWPADEESTPAIESAAPESPASSVLDHDQPETPPTDAEDSNWDLDDSGDLDEPGISPAIAPEFATEFTADAVAEPEPEITPEPNPAEAIALEPQTSEPETSEP